MALHHAKHADDEAAREKQEAEITRLYFTNRQEAHARLRGTQTGDDQPGFHLPRLLT